MVEPNISAARAARHEALVLKLEALLHELRPLALRQPAATVPEDLRALAEGLLYDATAYAPRRERQPFPVAAPELGALALQLGQVSAGLEAYEVRHTFWSREHGAYLWRLTRGDIIPVARLRPQLLQPAANHAEADRMRDKVVALIKARVAEAYEEGFAAAKRGQEPPPDPLSPPGERVARSAG